MNSPQHQIQYYLTKYFFLNPKAITANKTFNRDLGLNGLELNEIIAYLETFYRISLPDDSISPKLSVGQLSLMVVQNVNNSSFETNF